MGFLERFQKIKGVQEAAEAASNVLNQTTTGRVGGNLGKIEPELQAPIVNPGSVADGDKNPANLVKQQLATTEKPAIAAAVKIEKEKKDAQAQAKTDAQATMQNIMGAVNNPSAVPEVKPMTAKPNIGIQKPLEAAKFYITGGGDPRTNKGGASAPEVQTVTEGGTKVEGGNNAEGGTKDDVKTDEQKKAQDEALRNAGVASMQKTLTPTFATGRDKVSEFQEMMANQEQESDRLKRAEDRAERRKENLKAIYGILNGAGAALAGRKGLQTGAKEAGEKVIKNVEDQFTKRMAKAREDLKEKQARELKSYMLKMEDAKQKKEDEQKEREEKWKDREYQLRVNADKRAEKETESRIKAREDNAKYKQDKLELDYVKLKKQNETDPLKKQQLELREAELELEIKKYEESLKDTVTTIDETDGLTGTTTSKTVRRSKEGGQGGGDSRLSTNGGSKPKRKV